MPRITRKQQKVFAVDASNNGVFGSLQANDPVYSQDPDVIQSRTAYANGWNDATYSSELLPPLEEFQGLQYLFSRQLSYVFQEGVPEWETNTTYYTGSICKTISGTRVMMFISLVDNNQGNLTSDTTKWYMFFDSNAAYSNVNLDNLTYNGKNIGNWSSNVTNCITYIPQDIKLELTNGTLTLKAGSKCYLKTDTTTPSVSVSTDLTTTQTTNGTYFAIYNGSGLTTVLTTAYNYSTLPDTYSYPLGIVTVSGGAISSINQVFNGFGYIGSTIFALPGVKGLIPNGRNLDGTLKSTEYTVPSVKTSSLGSGTSGNVTWWLASNNTIGVQVSRFVSYNEETNYNVTGGANFAGIIFATTDVTAGKINSLDSKPVFHAPDYHDVIKYKDISTTAGTTTSTASPKSPAVVVQNYKNGTDWYRVWSDGWIEQGGYVQQTAGTIAVTLLKAFSDTNYNITKSTSYATATSATPAISTSNKTTTGFKIVHSQTDSGIYNYWRACGY